MIAGAPFCCNRMAIAWALVRGDLFRLGSFCPPSGSRVLTAAALTCAKVPWLG